MNEIDDAVISPPANVWDCCMDLMMDHMTEADVKYFGGGRWVMPQVIWSYDDPEGYFGTEKRAFLKLWLVAARYYCEQRQTRSHQDIADEIAAGISSVLPAQFSDATPQMLQDFERVHEKLAADGTVAILLASLPLADDPIDHRGMMDLAKTWLPAVEDEHDGEQQRRHWFGMEHVIRLEEKLAQNPLAVEMLDRFNDWLADAARGQGKLTMSDVAVVGCLWRKNIRVNHGEVPTNAYEAFCINSGGIMPRNRMLRGSRLSKAKEVLYGVRFMELVRMADRATGKCAQYRLLDESAWE